jgi:hypothetical protein
LFSNSLRSVERHSFLFHFDTAAPRFVARWARPSRASPRHGRHGRRARARVASAFRSPSHVPPSCFSIAIGYRSLSRSPIRRYRHHLAGTGLAATALWLPRRRTRSRLATAPPGTISAALGPRKLTGAYARERRPFPRRSRHATAMPHHRAAAHVAAMDWDHRKPCNLPRSTRELEANASVPVSPPLASPPANSGRSNRSPALCRWRVGPSWPRTPCVRPRPASLLGRARACCPWFWAALLPRLGRALACAARASPSWAAPGEVGRNLFSLFSFWLF